MNLRFTQHRPKLRVNPRRNLVSMTETRGRDVWIRSKRAIELRLIRRREGVASPEMRDLILGGVLGL
jgi:hypothetical protein